MFQDGVMADGSWIDERFLLCGVKPVIKEGYLLPLIGIVRKSQ